MLPDVLFSLCAVQLVAPPLQSDALEHALIAALPLGPQSPAGGVTLPDSFKARCSLAGPSCASCQ